jgi:uncharacterized membrane protein required for colicin V production
MTLTLIIWVVTFAINYLLCNGMIKRWAKEDEDPLFSQETITSVFFVAVFIFSPLLFVVCIAFVIHGTLQDGLSKALALLRLRRMKRRKTNKNSIS